MKRLFLSLILLGLVFPQQGSAQIYVDVLTAPQMTAIHAPGIRSELKKTNNELSAIKRGQLFLQTQLGLANDLQQKVLTGLQQVSGTLRNALTVRQIYETSADIIGEMQ